MKWQQWIKKYQWAIGIGIGLILITLLFFNNEWSHLSFKKAINHDKFSAWGTLAGSLLTAITVFLLYRQNKHIIDERKLSEIPVFFIFPCSIKLGDSTTGQLKFGNLYDSQFIFQSGIYFKIKNIGLGIATNIVYKWSYTKADMDSLVNGNSLYIEEIEKEIDLIESNETYSISLTKVILPFLTLPNFTKKKKFPSLAITIKYNDIYGNEYDNIFIMNISNSNEYVRFSFKKQFKDYR